MLRDNDLILSENQAVNAAGGFKSSNVIDRGAANVSDKLGAGNPVYLIVEVATAPTDVTSLSVNLRSEATGAAGVAANTGNIVASISLTQAEARTVGTRKSTIITPETDVSRYLHAEITRVGGTSAGNLNIWLSNATESYQYGRSGYEVK